MEKTSNGREATIKKISNTDTLWDLVIIGGGAVGLSTAYHLGKLGSSNVTLLERNELTSGTSWHAAGIVGPFEGSKARKVLLPDELSLEQFLKDLDESNE